MSITVKIMNDTHPKRADESVSARFKLVHIPDGGSFQINRPEPFITDEEIAADSPFDKRLAAARRGEGYCTLTVFDNAGKTLDTHTIDGNMYVMDNGKTISTFWGTTYPVEDPALADFAHVEEVKEKADAPPKEPETPKSRIVSDDDSLAKKQSGYLHHDL